MKAKNIWISVFAGTLAPPDTGEFYYAKFENNIHIDTFHRQSTRNTHSYTPIYYVKKKKSSNITTTLEWCVYLLCLCVTAAQHCNIGFGEPPLNPTEFSQPPVLLLLQNCDHIIFGEVEMAVRLCSPRAQSLSLHIPHHLKTHSKCHCIPQGSCILHKHYVVILKESCIPVHGWKRQSLWHELGWKQSSAAIHSVRHSVYWWRRCFRKFHMFYCHAQKDFEIKQCISMKYFTQSPYLNWWFLIIIFFFFYQNS